MALCYDMLKYLDKFEKYAAFIVKDDASLYVLEMRIQNPVKGLGRSFFEQLGIVTYIPKTPLSMFGRIVIMPL